MGKQVMGSEEGTCWDEHQVLHGNQSDSKLQLIYKKNTNEQVNQEISKYFKNIYMEANELENTTVQTLCDSAKIILTGIYIKVYLKKQDRSQIHI